MDEQPRASHYSLGVFQDVARLFPRFDAICEGLELPPRRHPKATLTRGHDASKLLHEDA